MPRSQQQAMSARRRMNTQQLCEPHGDAAAPGASGTGSDSDSASTGSWARRDPHAAGGYTDLFLDGAPGIVDGEAGDKFLWGLEELYLDHRSPSIAGDGGSPVTYLLAKQKADGQWWGDAIGGDTEGQSLDLRVNTRAMSSLALAIIAICGWRTTRVLPARLDPPIDLQRRARLRRLFRALR